jgi:8-oxo-dGTP pyrophosphatase MutT (NUDIX family)
MQTVTLVSELLIFALFRCCVLRSSLLIWFDMASLGLGNYVVVIPHVGGSKSSDVKLVLQRELRTENILFLAGSILPNEAPVDAAVRELFEESGLIMTVDLTMIGGNLVRVPLPGGQYRLVHVFSASGHVP